MGDAPEYVEGCFGCKASTLSYQNMHIAMVSRAEEKELNAYRDARKYGIQPKTTKLKDIDAAVKASDTLGRAVKA